jgi:hypothetical protein
MTTDNMPTQVPATTAQIPTRIGSGIIVGKRHKGRLKVSPKPFEHINRAAAVTEAERLAQGNPGTEYVVLTVIETILADKVK